MLEHYLSGARFDAHLARARAVYARRAERMARSLRRHLRGWRHREPVGGFTYWIESGDAGDLVSMLEAAVAEGVAFDPGDLFRPDDQRGPLAMRLAFSALPAARIDEGIARLARAIHRVSRTHRGGR